jgi:hypothetical protein
VFYPLQAQSRLVIALFLSADLVGCQGLILEFYLTPLIYCCWECKLVQPLQKSVWRFFKKLKIELPQDPAIPFLVM